MVYYNSSPGPGMLKHVAVSPHRARADSVSLASSASCCSLGSLEHRHDSVTDLSHRTFVLVEKSDKMSVLRDYTLISDIGLH
ncbi:hypothetical protein SFRURICE_010938 [Spodoptera frugiperda]|nr:hypothetical protein SFRURICE_010938 [Spodoptera frugiperda]